MEKPEGNFYNHATARLKYQRLRPGKPVFISKICPPVFESLE
jgi:hypothetical protein